jgi:hypothetical protein
VRADGTLYGEGQGVAPLGKDGSVSYRGSLRYRSSSARWKRGNGVATPFEYAVDPQGNTRAEFWEWK